MLFFLLSYFADMLDGTLARIRKKPNPYGMYIDAVADALYGILLLIKAFFWGSNKLSFLIFTNEMLC